MKRCIALIVLASLSEAFAGTGYTRIEYDFSSAPQVGFLRKVVDDRVGARSLIGPQGKSALKIVFRRDRTVSGENTVVRVADNTATVLASRPRGFVFGAGLLLRTISYSRGAFELEDGEYRFEPKSPIRIVYFARHFENWYHRAGAHELCRYVDDLALWGVNSIKMHLEYPDVDRADAMPGDNEGVLGTSNAFVERMKQLDLDIVVVGGNNCGPKDMPDSIKAEPNKERYRGDTRFNVCPEKPGAKDWLFKNRYVTLDIVKDVPVAAWIYWPYDEGGCSCDKCSPWGGVGYPKLMKEMWEINRKKFPNAKSYVSTWLFDDRDWPLFYKYLEKEDWIDAIIADAHEDFPKYLTEHPLPKKIPILTFPEISMWGRYPWGGTGAQPLPARFERLYRQAQPYVSGYEVYSEGLFEDINKIVVNGLYCAPEKTAGDVLDEYCRYEFPGVKTVDFRQLCAYLEETHKTRIEGRGITFGNFIGTYLREGPDAELVHKAEAAAKAYELACRMENDMLGLRRGCWRWRHLKLRALLDRELFTHRTLHTPEADRAFSEITELYHAENQMRLLVEGEEGGYTAPPRW